MLYTVQRVDVYDNDKPVQIVADKVPCLCWAKQFAELAGCCLIYDINGNLYEGYRYTQ